MITNETNKAIRIFHEKRALSFVLTGVFLICAVILYLLPLWSFFENDYGLARYALAPCMLFCAGISLVKLIFIRFWHLSVTDLGITRRTGAMNKFIKWQDVKRVELVDNVVGNDTFHELHIVYVRGEKLSRLIITQFDFPERIEDIYGAVLVVKDVYDRNQSETK